MPHKKKGKTQKKVHINLRKNKVRQIYCSSLKEPVEKLKKKKQDTSNSGNYKNSNNDSKLLFDELPTITMNELMKMA